MMEAVGVIPARWGSTRFEGKVLKDLCGKPVIQGTRLSVEFILNLLAHHMSWDEILQEYPGLTVHDIQACLLFARNTVAQGA